MEERDRGRETLKVRVIMKEREKHSDKKTERVRNIETEREGILKNRDKASPNRTWHLVLIMLRNIYLD
jgi:hypothetical protein